MSTENKLTEFIKKLEPNSAEIVKQLSRIICASDNRFSNDIKWHQLTFALDGDFYHWICAIAATKKSINLIFHFGGLLEDKDHVLIAGSSKFFRKLEFRQVDEINETLINRFIKQAVIKLSYFKQNWKIINKQ